MIVDETIGKIERFKELKIPVLLLGGRKSCNDMKKAFNEFNSVLPNVRRIDISGLGHKADDSVKPRILARELRNFFNYNKQL